jgi:DNA-binding NarL/FixJ family response regulator
MKQFFLGTTTKPVAWGRKKTLNRVQNNCGDSTLDETQSKTFKLLIVEDSDNFRLVFKELIKEHFCSAVIEEATSGEEVLIKLQTFLPDIIFMDIELPGSSGFEITRTVRDLYGTIITIIILTSQSQDVHGNTALACGADAFFEKGTHFDIISVAVNSFLNQNMNS